MLRAGRRDRQIIIQQFSTSETVVGAPEQTWTTYATVWAEYIPISGKEALQLNRETSAELVDFVILYDANITPKHRISYGGKTWDILFLKEIGRREGLRITAEARA